MARTWTVSHVCSLMERWYPAATAESWDRVGLILGDGDRPVRTVLLAVDPVGAVADEAIALGADMIITHHPLLLRGASFLPESDPKGRIVARLIRAGIALLNAHTNADCASDGVARALADLVGIRGAVPFEEAGTDDEGRPIGHGRIGQIDPMSLSDLADLVASRLPEGPTGLLVGGDEERIVERVAVSGGSGDSFLGRVRDLGADAYLCADLRHHPASEHLEAGSPALLCASHWATEWPWLPVLAERLARAEARDDAGVEVVVSTIVTEPWTSHRPTQGGRA
ncbi:Nif3-like dinuclear metal center hexameric protein [Actinomyces sp. B33]|uniref:Nif3-like dinuclear metal center hexameric protein n=1 Tax=Actinomyces sp. B33 TaxID=2942131 RepID=UPI0023402E12|nr:Nif3-like dinuclear metal center hexameric protein [Actinomyces sp. B33]MDC4232991.1 Nif3-like dinuclear metal center hexameric protein [Actinomyces sp. B33]